MFVFSWEGFVLGVVLSVVLKLGASLPASLAGVFFSYDVCVFQVVSPRRGVVFS